MKNLGIKSLNIISDQDATIDSSEFGTIKIYLKETTSGTAPPAGSVGSVAPIISSINSLATRLTTPAIEMARNLHKLLLHFDNLPTTPPTMNPININVKLYTQKLLEKLSTLTKEEFEAEIENQNDKDFLMIYNLNDKQGRRKEEEQVEEEDEEEDQRKGEQKKKKVIDFQSELNFPEIISEIDLLKLDDDFDTIKEETIKTLVTHLTKVYNKLLEEHIGTEIKRRKKFRGYINFLMLYRKIEIYCNLYKVRGRGETVKNQTSKKIIEYSSKKLNARDITNIIKTGKRIESLISLSNREWGIIDAFPNLEINFFKSTVSTATYEVWLKLVETGHLITEEEGQVIYNRKKDDEQKERKEKFVRIYGSVGMMDRADSPRYFPDESDDDGSPRYFPDDEDVMMNE
jgi:hypothetical protein